MMFVGCGSKPSKISLYDTHIELQYTPFFGDASHHGFVRSVENPPSLQGCYLLLSVTALAIAMSPWFTCHGTMVRPAGNGTTLDRKWLDKQQQLGKSWENSYVKPIWVV